MAHFGTGVLGQWAPLYDALLGAIFRVAGPDPVWAKAFQIAISPVAIGCGYGLARRAGDIAAARIAALAIALDPTLVVFSHYLYTETLFVTLLLAACWVLFRREEGPELRDCVAGGLLFGLCVLTRSVALYFLLAWPVWAALRGRRREARRAAWVAGALLLVVLPWTARNAVKYEAFMLVDGTVGRTAWFAFSDALFSRDLGYLGRDQELPSRPECPVGDAPGAPELPPTAELVALFPEGWHGLLGRRPAALPLQRTRDFATRDLAASGRCEIGRALAFLGEHPGTVAVHALQRFHGFWGPNSYLLRWVRHGFYGEGPLSPRSYSWWKWTIVGLHLLLVSCAILALARRPLPPFLAWSAAFVAYYTLVHVVSVAHSRYRLPVMPFVTIAAACWIARPGLPEGRGVRWATGGVLLCFWLLAAHYTITRLP